VRSRGFNDRIRRLSPRRPSDRFPRPRASRPGAAGCGSAGALWAILAQVARERQPHPARSSGVGPKLKCPRACEEYRGHHCGLPDGHILWRGLSVNASIGPLAWDSPSFSVSPRWDTSSKQMPWPRCSRHRCQSDAMIWFQACSRLASPCCSALLKRSWVDLDYRVPDAVFRTSIRRSGEIGKGAGRSILSFELRSFHSLDSLRTISSGSSESAATKPQSSIP
jgi:hypothetical protein